MLTRTPATVQPVTIDRSSLACFHTARSNQSVTAP